MKRAALPWLWICLSLVACQPQATLGEDCTDSRECAEGLSCFSPHRVESSDGCFSFSLAGPGPFCQRRCTVDADCDGPWGEGVCARHGCPGSDFVCFRRGDGGVSAAVGGIGGDR